VGRYVTRNVIPRYQGLDRAGPGRQFTVKRDHDLAASFPRATFMRSLYLHVSALNEDEYSLFTSSFTDLLASDTPLTTDADFEKQRVSIREARAWLRGRYADLPVSDLDQVRIPFSYRVTHQSSKTNS